MVGLADRARSPAATRRSAENDYIVLINSDGMMMPVDEGSWLSGWHDLIGDPEYVPMTYEGNIAHELFHIADGHFGQTIFVEQAAVRFANSVREQLNQPQRATVMGSTIHNLRSNECFLPSTPVLMADGTHRAISEVRVGDKVMAFDPHADGGRGGLVPRAVTATHRS